MHPDDSTAGISPSMTVGELVRLVDPHPAPAEVESGALRVDTEWRDPDLEAEIVAGMRARRLPFVWTGIVAGAGWGAWAIGESVTASAGLDAGNAVAVGTWVATAAALPLLRGIFRHRIPNGWRRRWWLAAACGAGWVDVAAAYGPPSWPMTGALIVGAAALSARWWDEHEVPNPGAEEPADEPEERPQIESSRAERIEHAWRTAAETGRGVIPRGALLTGRTHLPGDGLEYLVQLDPAAGVGASTLSQRGPDIALILRMSASEVVVEVGESEDVAVLTVIPRGRAVLAAGVPYPGPQYRDGRVPVALDVATRVREWVAYERGQGVSSGIAVGDMRSGKTTLLELVALGLRSSGVWRVWYGDGDKAGASSNLLLDGGVAHWSENTPEALLQQLAAFEAVLESRAHRKNLLTEDPVTGLPVPRRPGEPAINEFPPCPDFPGYMWIIPEFFQAATNDHLRAHDFAGRVDRLLRRAPKFGLGIAADTQSALGADFAGLTTLRAWLSRVNAFIMRTTNQSDRYAINGLTLSPGTLPRGGGWGLAAGQDGAGVMLRTMWQPDLHRWVPTLPPCADDPDAALAVAPYLPDRSDDPEAALDDYEAAMEEWREKAQAGPEVAPTAQTTPASVNGVGVPAPLGGNVVAFRKPTPAPTGPLPGRADEVLCAMQSRPGKWTASEVRAATGLSASQVSKAFAVLAERGLIRWSHGVAEVVQGAARGNGA